MPREQVGATGAPLASPSLLQTQFAALLCWIALRCICTLQRPCFFWWPHAGYEQPSSSPLPLCCPVALKPQSPGLSPRKRLLLPHLAHTPRTPLLLQSAAILNSPAPLLPVPEPPGLTAAPADASLALRLTHTPRAPLVQVASILNSPAFRETSAGTLKLLEGVELEPGLDLAPYTSLEELVAYLGPGVELGWAGGWWVWVGGWASVGV